METRLHSYPALQGFIVLISLLVICFPEISCQQTQPFNICGQTVDCGGVSLEYPFWGFDRPVYCGHPAFQLTCQSNVPILKYQLVDYRVLDIRTSTKIVTIARNDLWETFCPQNLYNTSYNSTLFNSDNFGQQNVSLYYDCNTTNLSVPLGTNYQFTCSVDGDQKEGYFYRTDLMTNFLVQCDIYIYVPVDESSATRLGATGATTGDLRDALRAGFNLGWTANNQECDGCIRSNGRCGSNSTSPDDSFVCYCANGYFSLTCNDSNDGGGGPGGSIGAGRKLIIGISCGIAGVLIIIVVILCRQKRVWETLGAVRVHGKSHLLGTTRNHQIEIFIKNYGTMAPNRFKYSEIKKMTNSFHEKLGQGGYGSVYKGQLRDGQLVAVKLLGKAIGDGQDFINEVASIGRTSHVNVVALLGFCFDGKKRALMYEFMPNGSLDKFLRGDHESRLDWNTLFRIAKGIARGLEYLHRGCNTRIVHFDIKPHNILLDEEFVPKISDFGLAKLCKRKESIVSVTGARGTAGYMAPEVFFKSFGGASHKSDVYSYGMMVLEMTGARKKNISNTTSMSEAYFPDWIYKHVEGGDNLGVDGVTNEEEDQLARKMVMVSLWCIQSDPSDRPSICKVVEMLEGSFHSLQVPPKRFWSSPTRPAQDTSPFNAQSSSNESLLTVPE